MRSDAENNPSIDRVIWTVICVFYLAIAIAASSKFADNYTVIKWIVLYFLVCVLLALSVIYPSLIALPRLSKLTLTFCLTFLGVVVSILTNPPFHYFHSVLNWISFSTIFIITFSIFQRKSVSPKLLFNFNVLATLAVIAYGYLQLFDIELLPQLTQGPFPSSFFGFQNHTAEFLGFSVLTQQASFAYQSTGLKRIARESLLILTLTLLYFMHARGANLATFAGLAVIAALVPQVRLKDFARIFVISALSAFLVHSVIPETKRISIETSASPDAKAGNVSIRYARWLNTAHMIYENPWGIGPGNYEFGYVPYHDRYKRDPESTEGMVVKSAHNTILNFASESGLLTAMSILVLLSAFLYKLLTRNFMDLESLISRGWVVTSILFLFVDGLFAFPLDLAFPFFASAIVAGIGLNLITDNIPHLARSRSTLLMGGLFGVALWIGSAFTYSSYLEFNEFDSLDSVTVACRIFPENWRACLRKAELETNRGTPLLAKKTLEAIIERTPAHFTALKELSYIELDLGNIKDGCARAATYTKYFPESKFLDQLDACVK